MADTQPDQPNLVTLHEAAERLDLSTEAARKRIQRGTLPGRKIDGVWQAEASILPILSSSRRPAMLSSASSGRQGQDVQATGQPSEHDRTGGESGESQIVDLMPLIALAARLHAQKRQLTEWRPLGRSEQCTQKNG